MIMQIILSFFATLSFSVLFNVPEKELFFCGLTGAAGWLIYNIALHYGLTIISASFAATLIITALSRIFANIRKTPITIFLISGIIPLVPGAGMYYTMLNLITYKNMEAALKGIETMKISGVIAIGIILILSLPRWFFTFGNKNYFDKQKNKIKTKL